MPYPPQGTKADLTTLELELLHLTYLFPEDTDETVTLTAGGTNNTFGAWAEIKDNNNVTLTSKAALKALHISSFRVSDESVADVLYMVEIGYGDGTVAGTTVVSRHDWGSGTKHVSGDNQVRVRPHEIPAGSTIYYRMKCETASATCQARFRYHCHD